MMKKVATFWLSVLLTLTPLMAQQKKPLGEQLRVQWSNFNVIVTKDGVKHPFSVEKHLRAYVIDDVKLLSAKASGDFTYLLFDITAFSRGPEYAQEECGVGEERSLIWLKVDERFKQTDSRSFPIESCWDGAVRDHEKTPVTFDGPRLIVTGSIDCDPSKPRIPNQYEPFTYTVEYSLENPDKGLQVKLVRDER